jgi:hypothetical protein
MHAKIKQIETTKRMHVHAAASQFCMCECGSRMHVHAGVYQGRRESAVLRLHAKKNKPKGMHAEISCGRRDGASMPCHAHAEETGKPRLMCMHNRWRDFLVSVQQPNGGASFLSNPISSAYIKRLGHTPTRKAGTR